MKSKNYIDKMLYEIKDRLLLGDLTAILSSKVVDDINLRSVEIIQKRDLDKIEIDELKLILEISNIVYENSIKDCPLEDGIYDLLIELYRTYNPNIPIGAQYVDFQSYDNAANFIEKEPYVPFTILENRDNMLFDKSILGESYAIPIDYQIQITRSPFTIDGKEPQIKYETVKKRIVGESIHEYPKLVGTLDKCKFVLNSQAEEKGVLKDPTVKIFERDFIHKHINMGIIHPTSRIKLMLMLKYDGISVPSEVSNRVLSATTRGDTTDNVGADLTPILKDYPFPKAFKAGIPDNNIFGMKFEAIMTYEDLYRFNIFRTDKASDYKNARTAIIGLFGAGDAPSYRDFITLVPLATSIEMDRQTEADFMNKYYSTKESLRYEIIEGDLTEIMFMVKRYVEEADYMRSFMPFMYDGVVVSYVDLDIINKLGRIGSINQYEIAIKFNPMKKQTTFRGYTFNVGQDGTITPMIHYTPVEFYGTIHPVSSGHSYNKFKELDLHIGDILDITYVNEVMPYVSKPDNSFNAENARNTPAVMFPIRCPECGLELIESESGKTMLCTNMECPGRTISRIVNMLKKLNFKDFAEENLRKINKYSLDELINISIEDIEAIEFGPLIKEKFIERIQTMKTEPTEDFRIVGSLGFNNIGRRNWKIILNAISLEEIINDTAEVLKSKLTSIKGIGKLKADTIIEERSFFMKDLKTISNMNNIIRTKGTYLGKSVRYTGVRNSALDEILNDLGFDADGEGSITKSTDIVIVPYAGYQSAKLSKISDTCIVVPITDIMANPSNYL
jgi:NAD-dependent DNA ligase